ncbi:multiple sugar transport system ATP-binding protein [Phyllobacterium trifolii]|uniref:Multiple sugar transport system ATP-binding protein n=1 Tax=Phyllobacterium trifolii TaxID=300193 RepID=A0A839UGC4_9HYPH|nr:sn-glycerol-3-phosphate ABC transporter ATP-binding protein UgpC [Phyllobacterium trifolii]MBB3149607.1 multiple sugar transport system ATP-binding protein [Phyllobacterium trifolii]
MAQVSIEDVTKTYGAVKVIHQMNFNIDDGEFVVLVGPSGCGKSTLLRMIAGLEEISGGAIRIGEKIINDVAPMDRDIAMVFQNYALYPHMTVAENMGFSLRLRGVPKSKKEAQVRRAAEMLGLVNYLDRYPRNLSGGQRQRVAMGRAIVRDPQVFLFDEPLSNLDAKLRVQMRTEIKELHQRMKTTTVYVTHDQIEAMTMADKIVVLRDGVIEQIGSPLDLYDNPANQFVASFIGSPAMNFIRGEIVPGPVPVFVAESGWRMEVSNITAAQRQVLLGVRPEHLEFVPEDEEGALPAEIVVIEPTGSETMVAMRAAGMEILASFRERHLLRPGEKVGLRPAADRTHIFDAESGQRLQLNA